MISLHETYMRRCFDLARRGSGFVAPNPMVGAVLAYQNRIIGEGWHRQYGGPHAEVNCLASVPPEDRHLIPEATLYCSLEPCFHYGKTPPCVDLVLREGIRQLVLSNTDPNPLVAGQSVAKLLAAGVHVETGVLETEGAWLNRMFFHWIRYKKPYVVLKWAQSSNGMVGKKGTRTAITGPLTQRLVHRWRSELPAIMVGTETAVVDNPRLDNRLFPGPAPLRIAPDRQGRIPMGHYLLNDQLPTWILGPGRPGNWVKTQFFPELNPWTPALLLEKMAAAGLSGLLVEGGPETLNQFLETDCWDEIRMLENAGFVDGNGIPAPRIPGQAMLVETCTMGNDVLRMFRKHNIFNTKNAQKDSV